MLNQLIKTIRGLNASIKTPFYLFDESLLENNYSVLCSLLEETTCRFTVAYSIKTNPLEVIALKAKACGACAEVTSIAELQLAKECGFEEIIFNGIYKTDKEMTYAAGIGAIIVLDGRKQISRICKIASNIKKTIKVGIRISSFPILNDSGTRFGISANETELKELAKDLISNENIDLCCLQMHLGTNISDAKFYQRALGQLYKTGIMLGSLGASIRFYDIGGGMPGLIEKKWQQTFCKGIKTFHDLISDPTKTLIIEPGRSFVESAGFLITRVVDIRQRIDGKGEDVIVDAGTNSIMGENWGISHRCHELKTFERQGNYEYRLIGSLCCTEDIILESYTGGPLNINDMFLITGVGAYDFSTSYEFSRQLPNVYFLEKHGQLRCIR